MSDTVEQIKSRLDIVDVISGYLKVQKAGANHKARCPFHNEKTPSFIVSPERQSWHCFGCNKGGDMFSFVQEIEGIDFVEAMRILAAKAGVALPEYRSGQPREKDVRGPLLAVAERSAQFFEKQLWHGKAGAKALAYLSERGLNEATIKAWRLGWAPNDWQALTSFLSAQGHQNPEIVAAGMAIDKNGRPYDRFRSRIMFPICDANGQVVGFTGRVFLPAGRQAAPGGIDGEPAKYVNTPATAIYDKSRVLYGLDKAKLLMRSRNACLLVEGNMDAIMSSQAGAGNVVATSGTALTPHQLKMLARYSTTLDMCFDADQAGTTATRRGIGLALSQNFTVRVLTIADPACKDPADYVAKHGAQWNDVAAAAKPALQYYYDTAVASYDPSSAQSKKSVIAAMGPLIRRLASRVEQSHWVGQLAVLLRADRADVQADVASVHDDIAAYEREPALQTAPASNEKPVPVDPLSQELLALVVKCPDLLPQAAAMPQDLLDPRVADILREPALLSASAESPHKHLADVAYMRAADLWQGWTDQELRAQLMVLGARLRERDLRARLAQLHRQVQEAEAARDTVRLADLLGQFQKYQQELNQLQTISST